jgi:hypothetical protein
MKWEKQNRVRITPPINITFSNVLSNQQHDIDNNIEQQEEPVAQWYSCIYIYIYI